MPPTSEQPKPVVDVGDHKNAAGEKRTVHKCTTFQVCFSNDRAPNRYWVSLTAWANWMAKKKAADEG